MVIMMGVMIVIMLAGFCGSGSHHGMMMGGHEKNTQKNESAIHDHAKAAPSPDPLGSVDPDKDDSALK
jgi:hypothetical protein